MRPELLWASLLASVGTPRLLLQNTSAFFTMYDYTAMLSLLCHLFDEHVFSKGGLSLERLLLKPPVRSPVDKKSISSSAIWDFTVRM